MSSKKILKFLDPVAPNAIEEFTSGFTRTLMTTGKNYVLFKCLYGGADSVTKATKNSSYDCIKMGYTNNRSGAVKPFIILALVRRSV